MAITVKATIINANIDDKGIANITIEFDDGIGKWQKTYAYNQTEPIDFTRFKDRIIMELRQDLKTKTQLTNITAQVGKQFILTL